MKIQSLAKVFLICIAATCLIQCKTEQAAPDYSEVWMPLFNGTDLSGWNIKIASQELNDNYLHTFKVDSGMLRVTYDEYEHWDDKFGHIFYEKPYSYYKLKFDHRFNGSQLEGAQVWADRNSGIMVHSQSPESMSFEQQFPISLEMQLLVARDENPRPTGNICTPGTLVHMGDTLNANHCINSTSLTYHTGEWIHGEIEVYGDSLVRHMVNGDTVLVYTNPLVGGGFLNPDAAWSTGFISDSLTWIEKQNTALGTGFIALQAESQAIDFKNIELLNLEGCMDVKAKNYKPYYMKNDPSACQY